MALRRMSPPGRVGPSSCGGFSLIEVIFSIGILGVALVSLLGLIGSTLGSVKQVEDLNAATADISKLTAILESTPFYVNPTNAYYGAAIYATGPIGQYYNVYTWVYDSNGAQNSPTIFLFYDEIPNTGAGTDVTPRLKIVRYNHNTPAINSQSEFGTDPLRSTDAAISDLQLALQQGRLSGPVIAMTISLSPLVANFQDPTVAGVQPVLWGTNGYAAPKVNSIFPSPGVAFPNPQAAGNGPEALSGGGTSAQLHYAEAYIPILVQVFSVPLDVVSNTSQWDPTANLSPNTRLFSYTTAKLR